MNNYNVESNFYYMNDESWIGDLTDGAKAYCEDGSGNILGLPFWESSVSGCYYNKTLFDELGLKPATTQAEFDTALEDAKLLLSHGADGLVFGFLHQDGTLDVERTRIMAELARDAGRRACSTGPST